MWCLHTALWWRRHWEKTGLVTVEVADNMADGWLRWLDWQHTVAPENHAEIEALEADHGRHLGYVRVIATRAMDAHFEAPVASISAAYAEAPLLRDPKLGPSSDN
jgi:hypothetical protein